MGLAEKVNPGFAYFDKPWLLAILVLPLTLAGTGGVFYTLYDSGTTTCTVEGAYETKTGNMDQQIEFYNQVMVTPKVLSGTNVALRLAADPRSKVEYTATYCVDYAKEPVAMVGSMQNGRYEIQDMTCRFPSPQQLQAAGYQMEWCPGQWEGESGRFETGHERCGGGWGGKTKFKDNLEVLSGPSKPFSLTVTWEARTCTTTYPTAGGSLGQTLGYTLYIELAVTAIISFFLVRSRAVSAKVGNEKDATVFNVLRSADGMQANILSLKSQVEALEEMQKSLQKQLGVPTPAPSSAPAPSAPPGPQDKLQAV